MKTVRIMIGIFISIHASREGSDPTSSTMRLNAVYFNPRFPRGKRPPRLRIIIPLSRFQSTLPAREATPPEPMPQSTGQFQSTLPAREATNITPGMWVWTNDFNPRFPRGKRRKGFRGIDTDGIISIHASREGSDQICSGFYSKSHGFQSTLPAREATAGI